MIRRFVLLGPGVVVLAAVLATLIAGPEALRRMQAAQIASQVAMAQRILDESTLLEQLNMATRDVAASIEPSVVFVQVAGRDADGSRSSATASGWVYDSKGHIVTNSHVVQSADSIYIQFQDGRVREAVFVGMDIATDIAIVRVRANPTLLHPARRASGEPVYQGDTVFAFGSPFGFKFSMSKGIVSGLGREARAGANQNAYTNFIQTDAAVNPGNSGGPLVDVNGRVVGMNTAIITDADTSSSSSRAFTGVSGGIGFAIPLDTIESVVDQIIEKGVVVRGFLGVTLAPIDPVRAERFGFTGAGVAIIQVQIDGPADHAGLKPDDVITEIDGRATPSMAVLRSLIANKKPEQSVAITVWRGGEALERSVTLAAAVVNARGALVPINSGDAIPSTPR